ncbi:hypothetical protein B6K86_02950 [Lachnospiraceae bacterium]|nr:hypothetical protein B6K86_02950 [Lachnospiraceae bacterium]
MAVDMFSRTNGLIFRSFDIHLEQSSHEGGANMLAERVAGMSGAQAVISTATDLNRTISLLWIFLQRKMICGSRIVCLRGRSVRHCFAA